MATMDAFNTLVKENNIKIKGIEGMPEIGITRVLFENPWEEEDDTLFSARGMRLTLAKSPEGKIFSLNKVSKDYKLVQHHEALHKALEAIINKAPEFGIPEIETTFTNNGGRMYAKMTFPEVIKIQEKDPIKPQVILTNSADLSKRFTLIFGAFRLICSNGMVIPDSRFKDNVLIRSLHKNGTLDLNDAIEKMMVGFESFSDTIGIWKKYTKKTITLEEFDVAMSKSLLSENQIKDVLAIPLRGFEGTLGGAFLSGKANAWQAYNAATQWITDNTKNEATALDRGLGVSEGFEKILAL